MKDSQSLKKKQRKFIRKNKTEELVEKKPVALLAEEKKELQKLVTPKDSQNFFKRHEGDFILVLIPLILLGILFTLVTINAHVRKIISDRSIRPFESSIQMNPYPFISDVTMPALSAKAAIITDADSQVILFSKNSQLRFSMASTTKIMTALAGLDYFTDKSVLTVKTYGVEGSTLGLQVGERFYFEDLLYMMLLPSANDAAVTIADNYPGGKDAFVARMNEKAKELHLENTHFSDPAGLDDDEDYTTVVEIARLASYAIKNKKFATVTGTREKIVSNVDYTRQYPLTNLNKLLGTEGVTGIKTGTTEGAGEVLVTSTIANGHTFIIVVMNSTQRFVDTKALLTFITDNVQYLMPVAPGK